MKSFRSLRVAVAIGLTIFLAMASSELGASAATGAGHDQIQGSGSSWAATAVNQWDRDVNAQGLHVVFTSTGSTQGRTDFANNITDYGVSDIGFQGVDPGTGVADSNCIQKECRAFAYEPIVAGGTSFPYHILVAGKLLRNLRLSGETLTKIFTYKITNWDDDAITKDNNGRKLPSLPIVVVTHSEGSGSTAQFTQYMNALYPSLWQPFAGVKSFLEYYPKPNSNQNGASLNGSDGVINFLTSGAANGAIGYDEYSYPKAKNYPVVSLLNKAGYFTLPSEYNVAVALQHAIINTDKSSPNYLLQTLTDVYVAPEVQAYPMSSYSYFLIPTGADDKRMTSKKRQTLADYLLYSVCQGQSEMGPIGYSPLPSNLVQASFAQTALLGAVDPKVDVSKEQNTNLASCDNPTFVPGHLDVNHLAVIAPKPPACAKFGAGPCTDDTGQGSAGDPGTTNSSGGTVTTPGQGGSNPSGSHAPGQTGSNPTTHSSPGTVIVNPTTGATTTIGPGPGGGSEDGSIPGDLSGGSGDGSGDGSNLGVPAATNVPQSRPQNLTALLAVLVVIGLLAVLIAPPVIYTYVLSPKKKSGVQ